MAAYEPVKHAYLLFYAELGIISDRFIFSLLVIVNLTAVFW